MSNKEILADLFRRNGYRLTLGQLLQYNCGYKCTSRFSELRAEGWFIKCTKGKLATENLYEAVPPDGKQVRFAI